MGLGYHIEPILKIIKEKIDIVGYEPFEDLRNSIEIQTVLKNIQEKFTKLGSSFDLIFSPKIDHSKLSGKKNIKLIVHNFYKRNLSSEFENFQQELFENFHLHTNKATTLHFRNIWLRNYSINLSLSNEKKITILQKSTFDLKGKIIVFTGASPELENDIQWIKQYRQYFFLIASDTSSYFLFQNKITPDLVISVDAGRGTSYHFRDDFPTTIPILTWFGGNIEIFRKENPIIVYFSSYPIDQILSEISKIPIIQNPSLNIAGLAKELAIFFQAKVLVFSGISFKAKNKKTHCKGTGYENYYLAKSNRKNPFDSNISKVYKNTLSEKNKLALYELEKKDQIVTFFNPLEVKTYFEDSKIENFQFQTKNDSLPVQKLQSFLTDSQIKNSIKKELKIESKNWKKFLSLMQILLFS